MTDRWIYDPIKNARYQEHHVATDTFPRRRVAFFWTEEDARRAVDAVNHAIDEAERAHAVHLAAQRPTPAPTEES